MLFDKESEVLLKQNIKMYKTQMEELETQVFDLKTQLNGAREREGLLKRDGTTNLEDSKRKEHNLRQEIESLKQELYMMSQRQLQNSQLKEDDNSNISRDSYVKKLEMNIKFLESQTKELIEEKSALQTANENLENEIKNISEKLYREIEEKYRKEIDEKNFIIKSLKRDFEAYMQMDADSEQRSTLRKNSKKKLNKISAEREGKKKGDSKFFKEDTQETDVSYSKVERLENENFSLKERIEFLEMQMKQGTRNSRGDYSESRPNAYENEINQRRLQTLKESVLFWKEKSEKIGNTFFHAIKELKEDNERLRESLLRKVEGMDDEVNIFTKKIKSYYKKEQMKLLGMIGVLEEKHHENQAKLAEARSKLKNLSYASSFVTATTRNNTSKSKIRTKGNANFSP